MFLGAPSSLVRPSASGLAELRLPFLLISTALLCWSPAFAQGDPQRSVAGTLTVTKVAIPSSAQSFSFTGAGQSFSLDGDGGSGSTQSFSVAPGSYPITETVPAGWELDSASCGPPTAPVERIIAPGGNTATASVSADQETVCTFTNLQLGSVTVVLEATPESSDTFPFNGNFGPFSLIDDGTTTDRQTFTDVSSSASLSIGLTVPAGWELTASGCTGQNGRRILPVAENPLTPSLAPGGDLTCTFSVEDQRVALSLDKTVLTSNPVAGAPIEYEIIVTNAGPGDAFDVPVTDTMPPGLTNASWSCQAQSTAQCDNGSTTETGSGDLDEVVQLPADTSVTYNVLATIDPDFEGELINSAQIVLSDTVLETTPDDNAGSASVQIGTVLAIPVQGTAGRLLLIALFALLGAWTLRRLN